MCKRKLPRPAPPLGERPPAPPPPPPPIGGTAQQHEILRLRVEIDRPQERIDALQADHQSVSSELRDYIFDSDGWKQRAERFERKSAGLLGECAQVVDDRDRLNAAIARVRALHKCVDSVTWGNNCCDHCLVDFPCPTILALDGDA